MKSMRNFHIDFKLRNLLQRQALSASIISLSCALSACVMAPGMRMPDKASIQVSSGNEGAPPISMQLPVTEINMSLIEQLHEQSRTKISGEISDLESAPSPYVLGVGDVLQITVWDHPELVAAQGPQQQISSKPTDPISGFVIDQAGNIQYPYAGEIHVAGLTASDIQKLITEELSKPFRDPQVTVHIASFRSREVYVDGAVHSPGEQAINDVPMTIYEAISRAGGFDTTADQSRVELVRNGKTYAIDLVEMISQGLDPRKIILKNGDYLSIDARTDNPVYVMGEVNKPADVYPLKNGVLTLSEALSQAGSINSASADARQLYVIRGISNGAPQIYHLNALSPVSMILANDFNLNPKDVVYVDGNGLVRFSRVLNLLLPGINAGLTAGLVSK